MTIIQGDIGIGAGDPPSTVNGLQSYVHIRSVELVTTIAGTTILPYAGKEPVTGTGDWTLDVDPLPEGFAYEIWFSIGGGAWLSERRTVIVPESGTVAYKDLEDVVPIDHAGYGAPGWVAEVLELLAGGGGGGGLDVEAVRDAIGAALVGGDGITINVDDTGNTITITSDAAALDEAAVRDVIGETLLAGAGVSITIDGTTITVAADVTQGEVDLLAPRESPVFTGNATVPTATAGDNDLTIANTAFVTGAVASAVAGILNSAPGALDTLDELAAALGDDANYAATITAALAGKAADSAVVKLTGAQTIAGTKTFSTAPVVPDASFLIAKISGLQAALDAKAADSELTAKTVGTLVNNALLGVDVAGTVVTVVPDEEITGDDIAYDGSNSVTQIIDNILSRLGAVESGVPALICSVNPTITGTFTVGSVVTATNGSWTVGGSATTPDSYTYVWKRNGVAIGGATASTYTLVTGDIGTDTITVTVTAVKASHTSGVATSAPIDVSAAPAGLAIEAFTTGSSGSGTTQTVVLNQPADLADEQWLIAALRSQTGAGASDFYPVSSGSWARLGPAWPGSSNENRVQGFYSHLVTDAGSEPSTYTFQRDSAATRNVGVLFSLSGAPGSSIQDAASTDYLGTSITNGRRVASITVATDNSYQFIIAGGEFTAGNDHIPTTTPSGFTLLAQVVTSGVVASTSRTYVGVWWREVDAGATGTSDVAWGTVTNPIAHSVVIKPGS